MTDKALDSRYRRVYGITLAEYEDMFRVQNGRCAICHRECIIRLAVDHFHNPEIRTKKLALAWGPYQVSTTPKYEAIATVPKIGEISSFGETKKEVIETLKQSIKKYLVRGLLCSQCNRALGKVEDPRWQWGPEQLRSAADYLERYHGKK